MPKRPGQHQPTTVDVPRHEAMPARTTTERGYGYRWQVARKGWLAKHPLCVVCQAAGRVTAATDVDHRVPHRGDMVLFWDRSNWQGLCHPCHSVKSSAEDGGFGNPRKSK